MMQWVGADGKVVLGPLREAQKQWQHSGARGVRTAAFANVPMLDSGSLEGMRRAVSARDYRIVTRHRFCGLL
jgi:hypothetical protein